MSSGRAGDKVIRSPMASAMRAARALMIEVGLNRVGVIEGW